MTGPSPDPTSASPSGNSAGDSDHDLTNPTSAGNSSASKLGFGPPMSPDEVGILGPYRLLKELGRGGMGAVYAAIDTRLDRRLALKVMLPKYAADGNAKGRFLREARAAAKISHDNVVTVYEADEREGIPYIAMQYLEGYPLDEYLKKRGNPNLRQILRIGLETAAGLSAAHKIGLVHRDIKPGNLWLEAPEGRVKVLDFGLAKPVDSEVELTKSGAVVGTPAYMSPEQARGEKVDHLSDLFSVGALLYRLCTGELPFQGPNTMAMLMALATEKPKWVRELNPEVPEALALLVHQLLAKRASDRPPSALEVVSRIKAIETELSSPYGSIPAHSSGLSDRSMATYAAVSMEPPESNPFADLDDTEQSLPAAPGAARAEPAERAERRRPRGKLPWVLAGGLALVVVVGTVLVIKKMTGGSSSRTELSSGTTSSSKQTPGKTLPTAPKSDPKTVMDADRKAAEWAIANGGAVRINGNENDEIKAVANLPRGSFSLTSLLLSGINTSDADLKEIRSLKNLHTLILQGAKVSDAGLKELKELTSLRSLYLNQTQVSDLGLKEIKGLTNLRSLYLQDTGVSDDGLKEVGAIKDLAQLFLSRTQASDAGLKHLKSLKSLYQLDLNGTRVSDAGLKDIKELKELRILLLGRTQVTGTGLSDLKDLGNLVDLDLSGARVGDTGLKNLEELKGLKELHSLFLSGTQVSDAGLVHLRELKSLTHLYLQETPVNGSGLRVLKDLHELGHLDLTGTKVADAGTKEIRTLTSLRTLFLSDTQVSDVGLQELKELKNLKHLILQGTRVSLAGVKDLKVLEDLIFLDLRRTAITPQQVKELRIVLPKCQIEHDGSTVEPKASLDRDRRAAEWVLSLGGTVMVTGIVEQLNAVADLPKNKFQLTRVDLKGTRVSDAGIAELMSIETITVLNLHGTQVGDAGMKSIVGLRNLTYLILDKTQVSDAGMKDIGNIKNLRSLSLIGTRVGDLGLREFKELNNLHSLRLDGTQVSDAGLAEIKWLTNLSTLQLNGSRVGDSGLKEIKSLQSISALGLADTRVSDAGMREIRELKNLRELQLHISGVGDEGLREVKKLQSLQKLTLQRTKVTPQGLEELRQALPGCLIEHDGGTIKPKASLDSDRKAADWVLTRRKGDVRVVVGGQVTLVEAGGKLPTEPFRITTAAINDEEIKDEDLVRFAGLPELTELNFHICPVTDAGLAKLLPAPKLAGLNLERTKMNDAGLPILQKFPALKNVVLSANDITDDGLKHLIRIPGLEKVSLRQTKVTQKGLKDLAAKLPGCRIVHDGGEIEPTAAAPADDRKVAEWVLSREHGSVRVVVDEKVVTVAAGQRLPVEPFQLLTADVFDPATTDDDLRRFAGLSRVTILNLHSTPVTDAGLAKLVPLPTLATLNLDRTKVTDAGLPTLARFPALTEVVLNETEITDAGLAHLAKLAGLEKVLVVKTRVTTAGVKAMAEKLPKCRIEHDGGVIEPKASPR